MRYNVQYVDNKGELLSDSVESHDVRAAMEKLSISFLMPHASSNVPANRIT